LSVGIAQLVNTVLFATASLFLARSLIPFEYGRFAFGLSTQTLMVVAGGLGLTTAVTAAVARARAEGILSSPVISTLLLVRLASILAVGVVAGTWARLTQDVIPLLSGLAAGSFLLLDFLLGIMRGQLRATSVAIVAIVQPACYLAIVVVARPEDAASALIAIVGSIAITLLCAILLTAGRQRPSAPRSGPSVSHLRGVANVATYAYALVLLQHGYTIFPIILLGLFGMYQEAAELSLLMAIVRLLPEGIGAALSADYFPRLHSTVRGWERNRLFRRYLVGIVGTTFAAASLLVVFGPTVIHEAFLGKYDDLARFIPVAALLIVGLPIEALLAWTLLSGGHGGIAVTALATRLAMVLGGAGVFLLAAPDVPFAVLVLAPVLATVVSLLIQGGFLARVERAEARALQG
jgi:O-antigen/teichoic acid export membrane protein